MLLVAIGLLAVRASLGLDTAVLRYILIVLALTTAGIALAMSPMTAAIMSAVPRPPGRRRIGDERRDPRARRRARHRGARQHRRHPLRQLAEQRVTGLTEGERTKARSSLAGP